MAEPKLQIEKRLENCEKAIGTMATWLVQAQTGFSQLDALGIEQILRGERPDGSPKSQGQELEEEGGETGSSDSGK